MINYLWVFIILLSLLISLITGNISQMGNVIVNSLPTSLDLFTKIALMLVFWNGIFQIAIKSGLIERLARFLRRPLFYLFPELRGEEEVLGLVACNLIANVLGLASAATPLGLKAMAGLQKINQNKERASRSMITLVLLNASSLTLFPLTILGLRSIKGLQSPFSLILLMILTTLCSTIISIIIDRLVYRKQHL